MEEELLVEIVSLELFVMEAGLLFKMAAAHLLETGTSYLSAIHK